ncbi:MAG: DUF3089 domain-containing protein [Chitinophagales bacterium]
MRYWLVIAFLGTTSFAFSQKIKQTFDEQTPPAIPDYSLDSAWAALPWKDDPADDTPADIISYQDSALVDVFFIHPTTLMGKAGVWNGDIHNEKLNKSIDNWPIHHQASVFNANARIFAPRYRQANYESFMALEDKSSQQALNLAYQDVKTAFNYYMDNWNEGRPFIIAGHSQGSFHAIQLVAEVIDTTALLNQMVAAYLVGMPVLEDQYQNCTPCQEENDTHCFVSWNTMKSGNYPAMYEEYFAEAVCHNPLSWSTDGTYAEKEIHAGGVGRNFKKVYKKKYGAKVKKGILWVDPVNIPGIPFTKLKKNWHIGDYNLFYVNVRENVQERIDNFLIENKNTTWEMTNSELEVK